MLGIVASVMSLDIVLINLSDTTTLTTPPTKSNTILLLRTLTTRSHLLYQEVRERTSIISLLYYSPLRFFLLLDTRKD